MLNQKRLKELVNYDRRTGKVVWIVASGYAIKPGSEAGYNGGGYMKIGIDGKQYMLWKIVCLYMLGYLPTSRGKFRNGDKMDFSWDNILLPGE